MSIYSCDPHSELIFFHWGDTLCIGRYLVVIVTCIIYYTQRIDLNFVWTNSC